MKVKDRFPLGEIAKRILASRTSVTGAPVAFGGFEIEGLLAVLETAVEFAVDIPEAAKYGLILEAASNFASKPTPDSEALRRALLASERAYLKLPKSPYVLATTIAVRSLPYPTRAVLDGCVISITRSLPAQFDRGQLDRHAQELIGAGSNLVSAVRVAVTGRSAMAAQAEAAFRLDLLRSLWNLRLNYETAWRITTGPNRPVNAILLGQLQSMHNRDGSLATESYWFNDRPQDWSWVYDFGRRWHVVNKWTLKTRKALGEIEFRDELEQLLVRYVRACDHTEFDVSFNRLWAVLETLLSSIGEYKQLVRRTLFLYPEAEQEISRLTLLHLQDVRNGIVHDDSARQSIQKSVYQLKDAIERVFLFLLRHGARFPGLRDAGDFLDLPIERDKLENGISRRKLAMRLHGHAYAH